jgi:putative FmdB family regulatory protein
MPIYPFECQECGRQWDEFQKMNDVHESICCGKIWDRLMTLPNTHKDLAYNFISTDNNNNPVQIRSQQQYDKFLKKNGRVKISPQERKAARKDDHWHLKQGEQKRKQASKRILERVHKEGLSDDFKKLGNLSKFTS